MRSILTHISKIQPIRMTAVFAAIFCLLLLWPPSAQASTGAIETPAGSQANTLARNDDESTGAVDLGFSIDFLGTTWSQVYVNNNGNLTFGGPMETWSPYALQGSSAPIIAAFFSDVDTRNLATSPVTYGTSAYDGHAAFYANWINVGEFSNGSVPNSFQVIIVDRSDTGEGNFDIVYNYESILWDHDGASMGWSTGGTGSVYYENSASRIPGAFPDSNTTSGLVYGSFGTTQLGRYVYSIRDGHVVGFPTITAPAVTLEGNTSGGYSPISATPLGATVFDDKGITSFTHNFTDSVLPLGTTNLTWTAVNLDGISVAKIQAVTIQDTTAPTNPSIAGVNATIDEPTTNTAIDVSWTGAADTCSGVDGFSWSWTQDSASLPDTTLDGEETDASATSPVLTDGNWYFNIRTCDISGNWSTSYASSGPYIIDTVAPTGSFSIDGDAVSVSANQITATCAIVDETLMGDMRFQVDGGDWSDWQPFAATSTLGITENGSAHAVEAEFRDAAGNILSATDEIAVRCAVDTAVTNGTIDPSLTVEYGAGASVSYSPRAGFHLKSVTVDGTAVDIEAFPTSYAFSEITSDHTISVVYEANFSIFPTTGDSLNMGLIVVAIFGMMCIAGGVFLVLRSKRQRMDN